MLLVVRPRAANSFLFLAVRPGAPNSVLAPSSESGLGSRTFQLVMNLAKLSWNPVGQGTVIEEFDVGHCSTFRALYPPPFGM